MLDDRTPHNCNWRYEVGQPVKVRNGLPVPLGTVVTIKKRVPGLTEPGYIVTTGYDGDYWVRESELRCE